MVKRFTVMLVALCMMVGMQVAVAQAPPAPTNLTAAVVKTLPPAVELHWTGIPTPTMAKVIYKIYRSVDDSTHFTLLAGATGGYLDKGVVIGHSYYYEVTAVAMSHDTTIAESAPSNIAWAKIGSEAGKGRGWITGTVTDSLTGNPLGHVLVSFFRHVPASWGLPEVWTDSLGKYTAILDTGSYLVLAQANRFPYDAMMTILPPYKPKWFKDAYEPVNATPVKADSPATVADFALTRFVVPTLTTLTGTVKDTAGNALKGATVVFTRTPSAISALAIDASVDKSEDADVDACGHIHGVLWKGVTDTAGKYTATVRAGESYVGLASKKGYLPQYFDHKALLLDATLISIPATTKDSSGFDFNLSPKPVPNSSVAGVVKDSAGTLVPSHIILFPVRPGGKWFAHVRFGNTDSLGAYTITGVDSGKFFVLALPWQKYAPAFYKAGEFGVHKWQQADTVAVAGAVTGIDIGVKAIMGGGGVATLKGVVADGSTPVQGVSVTALDAQSNVIGYGMTDNTGAYAITGVPTGVYTVSADRDGYTSSPAIANIGLLDYAVNISFNVSSVTSVSEQPVSGTTPNRYTLEQNYPNPFNPSTKIEFALPTAGVVTLKVFNAIGQEVATLVNENMNAGRHVVTFDAAHLASGVYFYKVASGAFTSVKKMMLLK